jgi:hypothetical protein
MACLLTAEIGGATCAPKPSLQYLLLGGALAAEANPAAIIMLVQDA